MNTPIDSKVERERLHLNHVAELKDMRRLATGLLVLMVVLFFATSVLQSTWHWLMYPRAFAEAGIVGACADWFAVVALFRHPFGIPIPHTAIIARQKQRIGENLGEFIANNFLAPTVVSAKLETVDAAAWAIRWLREPANAKLVANRLQFLFPSLLELLNDEKLRGLIRGLIRDGIDSVAAAPILARILSILIAHNYHETVFDLALDSVGLYLDEHQESIRERVAKNSARWLPGWIDKKVTDAFLAELRHTIDEARAIDYPWRIKYRAFVHHLVIRLASDPALFEQCETIKLALLDNSVTAGYLEFLAQKVEAKVQDELNAKNGILTTGLEQALLAFGSWLDNDIGVRATVNRWTQQLVVNAVVPNRVEIGAFVAEIVAQWDTMTLVDKLELQVGRDLQFIRINGTLVGGLVGLAIFCVVRLIS